MVEKVFSYADETFIRFVQELADPCRISSVKPQGNGLDVQNRRRYQNLI